MNHGIMAAAGAVMLAACTLSVALPVQAGVRQGCGQTVGQTIAAKVTGKGTAYCVNAHADNVTLTVSIYQNGVRVAHRSGTAAVVPPTLKVKASYACTVGDTYQTTDTWGSTTLKTKPVVATSC
jgi:hypothetical protein